MKSTPWVKRFLSAPSLERMLLTLLIVSFSLEDASVVPFIYDISISSIAKFLSSLMSFLRDSLMKSVNCASSGMKVNYFKFKFSCAFVKVEFALALYLSSLIYFEMFALI